MAKRYRLGVVLYRGGLAVPLALALAVASSTCHDDRVVGELVGANSARLCGDVVCDGWCERPAGRCDTPANQGICRPHVRLDERSALISACRGTGSNEYVCACDGRSFPNDCYRRVEEQSLFSAPGSCPSRRACLQTADCEAGDFCDFLEGRCTSQGACRPGGSPDSVLLCDPDSGPVCGCDGKTYDSECARHRAGVSKARGGRCEK